MTLASALVAKALVLLNDDGTRWPQAELLAHLCDGMRDLTTLDPTAVQKHDTVALIAGAKQTLPDGAYVLLDVVGNVTAAGGAGKQIRMVARAPLDAGFPNWQAEKTKSSIANVMYDAKADRATYWVYPPATAGTKIELVYSYEIADIALTDAIPTAQQYDNPLLNYMLFRAFSKESEQQASAARAAAYLQLYNSAVGSIVSTRTGVAPQE